MIDFERALREAKNEIAADEFRAAVEKHKARILASKWWHKFVPFKIVIIRRT